MQTQKQTTKALPKAIISTYLPRSRPLQKQSKARQTKKTSPYLPTSCSRAYPAPALASSLGRSNAAEEERRVYCSFAEYLYKWTLNCTPSWLLLPFAKSRCQLLVNRRQITSSPERYVRFSQTDSCVTYIPLCLCLLHRVLMVLQMMCLLEARAAVGNANMGLTCIYM